MVYQKHSLKSILLLLLAYFFQLINAPTAWSSPADPVAIATQVDITQPTLGDILTYSTTEEIISHFKDFSGLNEKQKLQAKNILTESDKVKFAKAEVETNYDPIEPVIHFIKEATPLIQQKPN